MRIIYHYFFRKGGRSSTDFSKMIKQFIVLCIYGEKNTCRERHYKKTSPTPFTRTKIIFFTYQDHFFS